MPTLSRTITSLATVWQADKRSADAQLLDYVASLIASSLPGPELELAAITEAQSLMAFLLHLPNALRIRTALSTHANLVNAVLLGAAREELARQTRQSPGKQLCLAMYLIARELGDRTEMATGLLMWGSFCREQQAISHAERHFRRASEMVKDIDDSSIRLMIKGAQAGLYRSMHRYRDACATLEEGLELAEAEDHAPAVASFADGLASCYRALGEPANALDAVNRLILVADRFPGKKSRALNFRGLLYEDLGRYEIGKKDYDDAAAVAEAERDRSQQFTAMTNSAASLLKRRMNREGYHAFQDVLRKAEEWGNPLMLASTHINLGHALSAMENYGPARAEFRRALQSKINTEDRKGEVIALLGLGDCEIKLGNPAAAKALFALALIPAIETQQAALIGQVQLAIFDPEICEDDGAEALNSLRWARDLAREQAEVLVESMLVRRIAEFLRRAGRIDEAVAEYDGLLKSRNKEFDFTALLTINAEYARLLAAQAVSWPKAVVLLRDRLHVAERMMDDTLIDARLGEIAGSARVVYAALLELLDSAFARTVESQPVARFAFDLHESAKARSLLAQMADAALTAPPTVSEELQRTETTLLAEKRRWQEGAVTSERRRYEALETIRTNLQDCWERMRQVAPDYVRGRSNEPYTFGEILETLRATTDGHTALASFFVGTNVTQCFVVRADQDEPIMLSIPLRETELEEAVLELQRTFNGAPEEFPPFPPIRGDMPYKRKLDVLERIGEAMRPLFACLEGIELICVAPHGPLHTLPLHALRLSNGQYLAEKYAIVYTPSLSVATNSERRATLPSGIASSNGRALVVGVSSADDAHPEHFEVDAALFESACWDVRTAIGVDGASRDAIIASLQGNRVIHFSCHAYFDAKNPQSSGLILTNGLAKAPRDLSLLSFLERQSYVLTVRDLMRVRLDTELVTLSACSTGLQRDRNAGDELEGFARALLRAGAESTLLTMWNVDQSSSYELLSKFYHNWTALGLQKWKALQIAQRELINGGGTFAHPYHWAPFTLIGSWR